MKRKSAWALLGETAELAKKQNVDVPMDFGVLGDGYHVYGVNLTPSKLLKMLIRRNETTKHQRRDGA